MHSSWLSIPKPYTKHSHNTLSPLQSALSLSTGSACENFVMTNIHMKNMPGKISSLATGLCPRGMNQSVSTRKVPTSLNLISSSTLELHPKILDEKHEQMPPASAMAMLILIMV
jgi:hypothetical protein